MTKTQQRAARERLRALEAEGSHEEDTGASHEYELSDAGKALFDNAPEDLRLALDAYERAEALLDNPAFRLGNSMVRLTAEGESVVSVSAFRAALTGETGT